MFGTHTDAVEHGHKSCRWLVVIQLVHGCYADARIFRHSGRRGQGGQSNDLVALFQVR